MDHKGLVFVSQMIRGNLTMVCHAITFYRAPSESMNYSMNYVVSYPTCKFNKRGLKLCLQNYSSRLKK